MGTSISCDTGRVLLDAIRDGILEPPPAARLLRLDLESVGDGFTVFGFDAHETFANPTLVHGGVLAAIVDFAVTTAIWTRTPATADIVTADLHVSYLRSVPLDGSRYRCHGTVLHLGRSQANATAIVVSEAGTTHLHALATCRIRPRR
jgi:uncharacterized protein (TIGR00369 family)